jgi:hypothetical protein
MIRGFPILAVLTLVLAGLLASTASSRPGEDPASALHPGAEISVAEAPIYADSLALASAPVGQDPASLAPLSERAMRIVQALADGIGSRPAGSASERTSATFLADEFTAMGYAVDVVPFSFSVRGGSGRSQNVVATDPNESPNLPLVIIGGHYDSVPVGPGANDNASGTATTLEIARQLAVSPEPGVAIRYIAFGAEEIGLLGSRDYVSKLSRADRARLRVAISIDMMAVGAQPAFGGSDPWLSEALARAASQGWRPLEASAMLRRMSDHASFLDVGLPAIMFHWVDDPYYHTALDVSANVQPYSLELMGAIAIGLIRVAAS